MREEARLFLPGFTIGRSVGAMARNYDIELPDGEFVKLAEGTAISNVEVIAGKDRQRKIDIIERLTREYGGEAGEWQKMKAIGYIDFGGEVRKAELHWYQEKNVGRVMWKVKAQRGGGLFLD